MIFRSLAIVAVLFGVACAPRYDVNVSWTLDGVAAGDACAALTAPSVAFRIDQQDDSNGPVVTENESAPCAAGRERAAASSFSSA